MNILLILIIIFVVIDLILHFFILSRKNNHILNDEDLLKLKLNFSQEFNKLTEKLNVNNDKLQNQLTDFKSSTNENILKAGKDNIDSIFNFNNKLRNAVSYTHLTLPTILLV